MRTQLTFAALAPMVAITGKTKNGCLSFEVTAWVLGSDKQRLAFRIGPDFVMSEEKLNLPERMLAMELAQLLAIRLDAELVRVDGELYNIGQSNYECACHALNLVGVYQQAQHYTRHKVVVPVERIHEHMTELNAISREAFDTLLSAFIENFITYGGG